MLTKFALIFYFRMVAHKAACHTLSTFFVFFYFIYFFLFYLFFFFFETEKAVILLIMVLFTHDSKVENLFCGAPSGS